MRIISNPFRFINSIRHASGFGVHSPFAFNLISDTIYCPHSYYIYDENRSRLNKVGLLKQADVKYAELLFRLTNKFNSKSILEIGSDCGINTLYIRATSEQTAILCVESDDKKIETARKLLSNKSAQIVFSEILPTELENYDAVFWNLALYPIQREDTIHSIKNSINEGGFIVLKHINSNKQNREVWKKMINTDSLTMSFDLGSIGICFCNLSLPKLNYDVFF